MSLLFLDLVEGDFRDKEEDMLLASADVGDFMAEKRNSDGTFFVMESKRGSSEIGSKLRT